MKLLILLITLLTSACGTGLSRIEMPQQEPEIIEVAIEESAPLIKFENGITKTVEFAFEGMEPQIELIPKENKIVVNFSDEIKELINSSDDLAETIEESAEVLYESLGQIYLFDGILIVDQLTIVE